MTTTSLDTNVVIYAFQDGPKQSAALDVLSAGPIASVQLLNEYAAVASRKQRRRWQAVREDIDLLCDMLARIDPISRAAHAEALRIAERYHLSFYDALMLAVALSGGARIFYSEDMQHDFVVDGALRIVDPFRPGALST